MSREPIVQQSPGQLIATSPIVKHVATVAFRIVIKDQAKGYTRYAVWAEYFPNFPDLSKSHFAQGDYFHEEDIGLAMACFAHRVGKQAEQHSGLMADHLKSLKEEATA